MIIPDRSQKRAWNFSLIRSENLGCILETLLADLASSALVLPNGRTLHLRADSPADFATLPQAASLCHQYLRLKPGQFAIVNDPYSGGTTLSEVTLVAGIQVDAFDAVVQFDAIEDRRPKGGAPGTPSAGSGPRGPAAAQSAGFFNSSSPAETDLLLVHRLRFEPRVPSGPDLDHEGVRIPPTPIGHVDLDISRRNGRQPACHLNDALLAAIGAHPLAPSDFAAVIRAAAENLGQLIERMKRLARDPASEFKKVNFKTYLSDSSLVCQTHLSRLPLGTSVASRALVPGGETIKLRLDVNEARVQFDFAGSDPSNRVALTELATFGACFAATESLLGVRLPMNSGTFEHFQVSTPAKTLFAGRAPAGVFTGINFVIPDVCHLVLTAFSKLAGKNSSYGLERTSPPLAFFTLEFEGGQVLGGTLAPGGNADKAQDGLSAFSAWGPRDLKAPSIEDLERVYPVQIMSSGLRSGAAGSGKHKGGDGEKKVFRVMRPGILRWSLGGQAFPQDGLEGGRAGRAAQILVLRADGGSTDKQEDLTSAAGSTSLRAGDQIFLFASSGGGFGKPADDSPTAI